MRQAILDYIQTLDNGSFNVSNELPWSESGTPLYLKNLKKIYVDVEQYTDVSEVTTLSGLVINEETLTVRLYFANDAKNLPPDYSNVVAGLRTAKRVSPELGYIRREVDATTELQADRLITTMEFRFIQFTS